MTTPPVPVPSSTVLLLRDGDDGRMEVFMVVRHHQIDFASGALVFPGGKAAKGDSDPGLRARCHGAGGLTDEQVMLRTCAIREAFEECGVLLARKAGSDALVGPDTCDALDSWRVPLDKGEKDILEMLEEADLFLALDALQPFAHWITPEMMPKRFDTHFYLAIAPSDQLAAHDGRETVDSTWINPSQVLKEREEGKWTIIFPTRLNIEKLAKGASAAEAIARARADTIRPVTPWVDNSGEKPVLRIRDDAGYDQTVEQLDRMMG